MHSSTIMPIWSRPGMHRVVLLLLCLLTVAVRMAVLDTGAHRYDSFGMREWTWALVEHPLSSFYGLDHEVPADHLPGDMLLLAVLGTVTRWISPGFNFYHDTYIDVLKSVAMTADVGIVLLLFALGRRYAGVRWALTIAGGYALNPASIVVTGMWGQWDSVSLFVALGATGAMLGRRVILGMTLLTVACLIKPQYGFLLPAFSVWWARELLLGVERPGVREIAIAVAKRWRTVGVTVASMTATILAICLPFDVGITGLVTRWTIGERLAFALDRYQATTLGANNVWMVPIGRGAPPWDQETLIAGLTYQAIGTVFVALGVIAACAMVARMPAGGESLVWGSTFMMTAAFLFSTRMHERYLFPVVGLALLLSLFGGRYAMFAAGVSVLVATNAYLSLAWGWGTATEGIPLSPALNRDVVPRSLSLATMAIFGWLTWRGVLLMRRAGRRSGDVGATAAGLPDRPENGVIAPKSIFRYP